MSPDIYTISQNDYKYFCANYREPGKFGDYPDLYKLSLVNQLDITRLKSVVFFPFVTVKVTILNNLIINIHVKK